MFVGVVNPISSGARNLDQSRGPCDTGSTFGVLVTGEYPPFRNWQRFQTSEICDFIRRIGLRRKRLFLVGNALKFGFDCSFLRRCKVGYGSVVMNIDYKDMSP